MQNYALGVAETFGVSYEQIQKVNPQIIYCAISGFGQKGPYSSWRAYDNIAAAMGGLWKLSDEASEPPARIADAPLADHLAGLNGTIAILAALEHWRKTGEGQHIDISLQEAVSATLEHVMVRYFSEGIVSRRQGSRHWNDSFCILPCEDGHILLSPSMEWDTLVDLLANEGLAADLKEEKWRDEAYRAQHFDHIIQLLQRWTSNHTTAELFELGQLMRLPWAPVASPADIADSPQLNARNFFVPVAHPEADTSFIYPGAPYKFSRSPWKIPRRAPLVGEHNARIYTEELGLSKEEIDGLAARHVI